MTGDRSEIDRVVNGITESRWELLEYGLRQVPAPDKPGLYPFELPGDQAGRL